MNRSIVSSVLMVIGVLVFATSVDAAVVKYDPSRQGIARGDGPYTVGSLVRVGASDRVISHLGAQDADEANDAQDPDGIDSLTGFADDDGFLGGSIDVGIWTNDGSTLLASATVASSDPYIGGWRYAPIASGPITLTANTDYLIGAFVGDSVEWFLDSDLTPPGTYSGDIPFSGDDGFTIVGNRFAADASLAAPTNDGNETAGRWAAANAMEIAEPPSTSLFTYDITQQAESRSNGPYTIGNLFKVGSEDRWISHLGAQDVDAAADTQDPDGPDAMTGFADDDGFFNGPINVGLWTGDGNTLLATVSVTSDDRLIDSWRYALIPGGPIILEADTDYLIGAFVGGGIEWFLDGATEGTTPFAANTGITLLENRFLASSFGAPVNNGGVPLGRWAAANAIYVPEPSTWVLALLGLMGLALARCRRRLS